MAQFGPLPGAARAELLPGDDGTQGRVTVRVYPQRDEAGAIGAAGAALTVVVAQAAQAVVGQQQLQAREPGRAALRRRECRAAAAGAEAVQGDALARAQSNRNREQPRRG